MEKVIEVPNDVQVEVAGFKIKVSGPLGNLERDFYSPLFKKDIVIQKNENKVLISTASNKREIKAMMGTIESILKSMIKGVKEVYTARLKVVYMHFPFTIKVSGEEILVNNFLGEKNPRKARILGACKVEVQNDEVIVTGINKEAVGQTAAQLEKATWIKKRDRRVFQDGLFITKKP